MLQYPARVHIPTEQGHAAAYAVSYVTWEAASAHPDTDPKLFANPNPFVNVLELLEMGVRPRGFSQFSGEEKLVVHIPATLEKGTTLGCFIDGDERLLRHHELQELCTDPTPATPEEIEQYRKVFFPSSNPAR
ncbi:MAG: hypothetical protein HY362_03955 [Candidatus Aenigmarchaeota archaeon]|nr:hypothetical protein [Candidatus Aenigmarchaeota archaeon]